MYSLSSAAAKLSFEAFPPKRKHKFRLVLKNILSSFRCECFKFSSLTCGAGGGSKRNSARIAAFFLQQFVSSYLLAHTLYPSKTASVLVALLMALLQAGVFSFLFIKGDRYSSQQALLIASAQWSLIAWENCHSPSATPAILTFICIA
ncbi:MAG: methylenetetrahydrofolate reductase [Candidatus Hodgkinia cicadicola]